MQVQESEPTTSYVVNDPSFPKISPNFVDTSDLNLPIAVRKDTSMYSVPFISTFSFCVLRKIVIIS